MRLRAVLLGVETIPIIGVDFDNTIVCYDSVFFNVGLELGLVPESIGKTKQEVRRYIQMHLSNDLWTMLQGEVYGARLLEAEPFPGVTEFFVICRQRGIPIRIISHKSRYPALGKPYDLHRAAMAWLDKHGFFAANSIGLSDHVVVFSPDREQKIQHIVRHQCTSFVDDLPEVFAESGFPMTTQKILFDPNGLHSAWSDGLRITSWTALRELFFTCY